MTNQQLTTIYFNVVSSMVKVVWPTPCSKRPGQEILVDEDTRNVLGTDQWLRDQTVWDIGDFGQFRIGYIWISSQKTLVAEMPPGYFYPEKERWQTVVVKNTEALDTPEVASRDIMPHDTDEEFLLREQSVLQANQHETSVSSMSDDTGAGFTIVPIRREYGQHVSIDETTQFKLGIAAMLRDQTIWDVSDFGECTIGMIWAGGWRGQKILVARLPPGSGYPGGANWTSLWTGQSEDLDYLEGHFEAAMKKSIRFDYRDAANQRGVQNDID